MSTALALRLAPYALVLSGLWALLLARLIETPLLVLALSVLVASWWRERIVTRMRPAVGRGLAAVAGLAVVADFAYLAETVLDGLVHALLVLVLFRMFTLSSLRDIRAVSFLAFFMLVAASSATLSMGFLFVVVAFLVVATWLLLLQHLTAECAASGGGTTPAVAQVAAGSTLMGLAALASAVALLVAAGLFFVIPRVGLVALPLRARVGPMVTGFSDRVELGAYGRIETDSTVVMRVHIPAGIPEPQLLPNLRWRGIAFDEFDGRAWSVGQSEHHLRRRSSAGRFALSWPRGAGPRIIQEVYLEPIGADVIFLAPRALQLTLSAEAIVQDDMDSVTVPAAPARLHYVVESELEEPVPHPHALAPTDHLSGSARARYLQLPRLADRIGRLARDLTQASPDPYAGALRLQDYLSREFRYTLALERRTRLDPVEEFLFVSRAGNCEYFAASLAVMLRSLGVPARVVGGFQRGEWNPYGRYFIVRMSDAHSWVEAHFDDRGWVPLDPSPRGDPDYSAAQGPVALYLDALRMRWYRYVINWSLRDQVEVATVLQRHARTWGSGTPAASTGRLVLLLVLAAVLGAGIAAAAGMRAWRWRGRGAARLTNRMPRFYRRALRSLARRGLRPRTEETAREFLHRVILTAPGLADAFAQVTGAYERVRFGAEVLGVGEMAALESSLAALSRRGA